MDVLYPDSPLADGPTSNAHWRLSIPQDVPDSVAVPLATYRGLLERGLAAESVLARLESEAEMERRQRLDLEELTAAAHRGETPTGTPNMGALPDEIASARAAFRGLDRALNDSHAAVMTAIHQAAAGAHADALEASKRAAESVEATLASTQGAYQRWVLQARACIFWQAVTEGKPASFSPDTSAGVFGINGVFVDRADAGAAGSSIMREVSTVQQLLAGPTKRNAHATDGFTEPKRRVMGATRVKAKATG